ncbi:DUF6797 domain-containing protein [Limnoglobus roseus]|uniref:Heme-binding protein n=1 Tax=Limnoglobus roseus TaxID=2598579 RepID=A0A5C1AFE1_9BACT|nr:DUF6797 domain-containing protein [Limnoglobus roseus]QEL15854.1 heme-binding protein [Limnoglobus roseus]
MRTLLALLLAPLATFAADPPKPPLVAPVDINDWTPRPGVGKAEPFERMKDPDWDDKRFQSTDTGPALNCTFRYPVGKDPQMAYKATVIKLDGGKAGVAFDRNTMRMVAGWTGGFVNISDRRFGLLNTPTPKGQTTFALPPGPGWPDANGKWDAGVSRFTAPLPKAWAKYRGTYFHGDRVVVKYTVGDLEVLESPRLVTHDDLSVIVRSVQVRNPQGGVNKQLMLVDKLTGAGRTIKSDVQLLFDDVTGGQEAIAIAEKPANVALLPDGHGYAFLRNETSADGWKANVVYGRFAATQLEAFAKFVGTLDRGDDLTPLTKPGGLRWGKPLVTKLVRGSADSPFAVDTLTIPYDNPYKALFFCTAVDFLPDGRIVMTTAHGDVWLVRVDEAKDECHWQRFATGLYQPLGVKVIDGKIHVLERGQLTRLHDENNDGEADFYECVNNDWHVSGGEHSYDTSLETDPQGNFFFHKTGDTDTPTGGTLMRISKDGSKADVYCTGFRHPIGLGISPTGIITGADQEGNWMPATRIDEYKKGGFYGDMRASHRDVPPKTYDPPLCWLPREVDNSAGCQVWVPKDERWGPLAGLPLHFSYGRCKSFVLLRQEIGETVQGGAADLGMRFLSGSRTGRFNPKDGQLYVVGLNGWQTSAQADGSLQRVRPTGKPFDIPVKMEVVPDGVKLTFPNALDPAAVKNLANFRAAWWGYRWSGEYGSKRWKVSNPQAEGQDDLIISAADLSADGKTLFVKVAGGMKPVQQMQLGYNLATKDTTRAVTGSVFLTVHDVGKK